MTTSDPSPLDTLAISVMRAQGNRESLEADLEHIPSWRFRRRRRTALAAQSEREREERLREVLESNERAANAQSAAP